MSYADLLDPKKKVAGAGYAALLDDKAAPSSGYAALLDTSKPSLESEVAALQAKADETGASSFLDTAKSAGGAVLDVLSRPNYAIAGAAEELFSPQGGGGLAALKRAGTELASGIGGLHGQKEGFGQVMEQAGVGKLGSAGTIPDWVPLFGGAEVTGRGALGLGLDIFTDPTTYLTVGATKGAQIAGHTIPGSVKAVNAMRRAAISTAKVVPGMERMADAVGGILYRDWKIRNLPGAVDLKNAHLRRQLLAKAELYQALGESSIAKIPRSKWAAFVDALDDGTAEMKFASDPALSEAVRQWRGINDDWAGREVAAGLLDPTRVRKENYVAHFYDNSKEELERAKYLRGGSHIYDQATVGRHAELRAFDTLAEAEAWSKAQHAIDPSVPILKPVKDPLEILRRRGNAHIEGLEFQTYYDEIRKNFGKDAAAFSPNDFLDLTKAYSVSAKEAAIIAKQAKRALPHEGVFAKLSADGKKELLRQRFLSAKEPQEILDLVARYGPENAPKQKALVHTLAEDGTPYVSINVPRLHGAEIPKSMADDLADMSERSIKSEELNHLLRWYDRANNTFKSFVTVMFPAFHARNAYSNLAQGFVDVGMSVLNPARHYDGYQALRGAEGAMTTRAGESIPYKLLHDEMKQNGVIVTGRQLLEYTGREPIERAAGLAGQVARAPRKVGAAIENEARASLYTIYRRRGLDVTEATNRVNMFLYDYSNLSRVEQDFFRRAIPFYTFMRSNLERQIKNVVTRPGMVAAEVKPFRGREDENGQMTSWEGNAMKLRLNRDGRTLLVLTGIDLPIRQLDLMWNGSVRNTAQQGLGMLSPILKLPIEVAAGANMFTGKEFDRASSPLIGRVVEALNPPQGVKTWLGYDKTTDAAGRPKYTFDGERFYALFQSFALSRLVSTSDRQFKRFADSPEWSAVMLDVLTGLRDKTLNLDDEQKRRLYERKRQLEEALVRRGAMKEFNRVYTPKGQ